MSEPTIRLWQIRVGNFADLSTETDPHFLQRGRRLTNAVRDAYRREFQREPDFVFEGVEMTLREWERRQIGPNP